MKKCIFCAESIQPEARLCKHCGREQIEKEAELELFKGSVRHQAYIGEYIVYTLMCFFFFIGLPFLIYRYLRTVSEKWTITNRRVETQSGIIGKKVDALELWRVKDIQYEQTILDRVFGEGRVRLHSTDPSHPNLEIKGLPNHRELYEELRRCVDQSRKEHKVLAIDH